MYVIFILKYIFLFFSTCVLPIKVIALLKKTDLRGDQILPLGLGVFFLGLIFLPGFILNGLLAILWIIYLALLIRQKASMKELAQGLWVLPISLPLMGLFYIYSGVYYDLKRDNLNLNPDILWHIGVSASKKLYGIYSSADIHFLNSHLYYHSLAHNLWAKFSMWTGDGLFESVLAGSRPAGIFFSCWVVFSFFSYELKNNVLAAVCSLGVFCASSVVSPLFVLNDPFLNILPVHLFTQVTGEELVFGVFFSALATIYRLRQSPDKISQVILASAVFLCLTIKSPYGVCLIGVLYFLSFWDLITRKRIPRYLWHSVFVSTTIFILIYVFHFGKKDSLGMTIEFAQIVREVPYFQNILNKYGIWGRVLVVIPYILSFFGLTVLPYIVFFKRADIKQETSQDPAIVIGTIVFFAGLLPFIYFAHSGYSQLYFAFAAQLGANFFGWLFIAKNIKDNSIARGIAMIGVIFSVVYLSAVFLTGENKQLHLGRSSFNAACLWIRNNTSEESLVAINNHFVFKTYPRFFNCSALAERQFLIEGYDYNDRSLATAIRIQKLLVENYKIFNGDVMSAAFQVKYLIFFKDQYGKPERLEKNYKKVFEQDLVTVYMRND